MLVQKSRYESGTFKSKALARYLISGIDGLNGRLGTRSVAVVAVVAEFFCLQSLSAATKADGGFFALNLRLRRLMI